jgi:hypothetical protein
MPHLQSWAFTDGQYALPAVGRHEILWVDRDAHATVATTPVHGQPVFIIAQPASPYVWVNFATPLNDTVQVVDSRSHEVVATLTPGKAILHMEFAPRGAEVWISSRDDNKVLIYDTRTREKRASSSPPARIRRDCERWAGSTPPTSRSSTASSATFRWSPGPSPGSRLGWVSAKPRSSTALPPCRPLAALHGSAARCDRTLPGRPHWRRWRCRRSGSRRLRPPWARNPE